MNEIERILALAAKDRTKSDLDYLAAHAEELSDDQKKQLELEKNPEEEAVAKDLLASRIGTQIHKDFKIEIKEMANGHLQAIVNSGQEDRHGEVLDIKGLDIQKYMSNPILANGHDYSKPSVGVTHKLIKRKDGSLDAEFSFATDIDGYNEPKILDQLYRKGYQFAFSIGFIPFEAEGNHYTKSEMIEFSPVLIGADARALLKSKELLKQKGIDIDSEPSHNVTTMNLQEILKKLKEQGMKALTLGEIAFIKEHKSDLTVDQAAECKEILVEEKKETSTDANPVLEAVNALAATVKTVADDMAKMKDADEVERKDISLKSTGNSRITKDNATKEQKFFLYVKGVQTKDFSRYIEVVGKAAYDPMNTTADNEVVPPAEFITEIERLEEEYGVAFRDANVRRSTRGAGIIYVQGDDDLEIYDTAEGGAKRSTRLSYKQLLLAWRKWAGILPMTDELTEDAAFDLWNDALQRFSRAFAKKADELVFTNVAAGGVTKNGILHVAGTNVVTVTGTMVDVTYDNLVDMIYGVPSQSGNSGKFYLNRTMLGVLMKLKDGEDRPIWMQGIQGGAPSSILGRPYVETEVLPGLTDDDTELPFMVYGNLRYATLGERTDLQMKMFDAGTVGGVDDADATTHPINLVTQDAQALRAVKRMNAVVRFPEAFSVLKTGATS